MEYCALDTDFHVSSRLILNGAKNLKCNLKL